MPARKLWARARNGHYLPNPVLQLRKGEGWQPVYEALKLDWIERGSGREGIPGASPAAAVATLHARLAGTEEALF